MFPKLRFRLFLVRNSNSANCRALLADQDAFDDAFDHLHNTYSADMKGKSGGRLTDFFEWLMAHKADIMAIIALFI